MTNDQNKNTKDDEEVVNKEEGNGGDGGNSGSSSMSKGGSVSRALLKNPFSRSSTTPDKYTKFFFMLSVFIASISVLAAYSSTSASNYNGIAGDAGAKATRHLVMAEDWWNNYQAHKLREVTWQTEIDNLKISLANPSLSTQEKDVISSNIVKYQADLDKLHADNSVENSLANLSGKAQSEENIYQSYLDNAAQNGKLASKYSFASTLLIIGAGLGGVSNIAKKRLLGYPCFAIGGAGVIMLLLLTFLPTLVGI
jgi:hypothetical protein